MTQLTLLDLPGCTPTKRGLTLTVSDEQLPIVGSRLMAFRGWVKWGIGSVLGEMIDRTPKTKANEPDHTWANDFADAHDLDPKERREILCVHTFYPPSSRTYDLSYEHYREAMLGVGPTNTDALSHASLYLAAAQSNNWTHTQLRRHIRSTQSTELPDTTQTEFQGYSSIFDFRRYILAQAAQPITPEQAKLILSDLGEDTLDYLDKLRAIAST